MNIEIGKTYAVSPRWKKCFEEIEYWKHTKETCIVTINQVWRSGTVNVTPQNEDEVEWLQDGLKNGDDETFEPYMFEEHEYDSAWDGCSADISKGYWDYQLDFEDIEEGYHENGIEFLEEQGFDIEESEVIMWGELDIEEI